MLSRVVNHQLFSIETWKRIWRKRLWTNSERKAFAIIVAWNMKIIQIISRGKARFMWKLKKYVKPFLNMIMIFCRGKYLFLHYSILFDLKELGLNNLGNKLLPISLKYLQSFWQIFDDEIFMQYILSDNLLSTRNINSFSITISLLGIRSENERPKHWLGMERKWWYYNVD